MTILSDTFISRLLIIVAAFTPGTSDMLDVRNKNYSLTWSFEILSTSENGDRLSTKENVDFEYGEASGNIIHVQPEVVKQTLHGIGTSFTESSAFVLAHLSKEKRQEVMNNIYSEQGANFSLARTVIGATDFSVEGKFSYDDIDEDKELHHFVNIADNNS